MLVAHRCLLLQKNTVKTLFGGVITNNVVSLVSGSFSLLLVGKSSLKLWGLLSILSQRGTRPSQLERGEVHHCALCVVLQDCDHVSQTAEEFYTVRCQVADMKNIYVSV